MEGTEEGYADQERVIVPGEENANIESVLDDICEKVVEDPCQLDSIAKPKLETDEEFMVDYTEMNELKFSTGMDLGQSTLIPSFAGNSRLEFMSEFRNEENDEDGDNESEPGDDKEPLKYELEQGNRILKEIMSEANKSVNWAFMDAVEVDKLGLHDYYDRIKSPMWLKKMKQKFENREYMTITEFAGDFRQMLENCYRYNGPDHYISKRGQRLETMFEQKLSLLSRELREKTSIAATTGQNMEEKVISGTRRRKVLVPHDSTALLNQLRMEEKEREREQRRLQMLEKQKEKEEFEQTLHGWEDKLLDQPMKDHMKTMWEVPAIGHFLFLCTVPLNLGEVMHWELERCFAMPRESLTMQTVMTSLLSTPYQRTNLDKKPLMPYKVWEEKLRVRLRHWYKIYKENDRHIIKTQNKIGLEEKFFKVVGHKNPMEKKKYHELTFYQRVWIMKGLCDWCMETQESIREAIEAQPVLEQRSYPLGCDADGNTYLHFPQFCGQDVRVYRQAPIKMPKLDKPKPAKQKFSLNVVQSTPPSPKKRKTTKNKKKKIETTAPPSPAARSRRDSRLRQNPKQVSPVSVLNLSDTETTSLSDNGDSGISENEIDDGQPSKKKSRSIRIRKPLALEQSDNESREGTPVSFYRSRMAALERITSTPSRESTPGPSPIPSRLIRNKNVKDDSSRASTPSSEASFSRSGARRVGRKKKRGRKPGRGTCRKVNLDYDEEESNSNLPDANGSVASNDLSIDMNENSVMDASDKQDTEYIETGTHSEEKPSKNDDTDLSNRPVLPDNENTTPNSYFNSDKFSTQSDKSENGDNRSLTPLSMVSDKSTADSIGKELSLPPQDEDSQNRVPKMDTDHEDSEVKLYNSSQSSESVGEVKDSTNPNSSPNRQSCDNSPIDSKESTESANIDSHEEVAKPFKTYKSVEDNVYEPENSDVCKAQETEGNESAAAEGELAKAASDSVMDACEPSTSCSSPGSKLVIKEESNNSASTSPYSVSDMSNDEMDTIDEIKSELAIKNEPKPDTPIKQEDSITSNNKAELDIKNPKADFSGNVKMEIPSKSESEKQELEEKVNDVELKTEGEEKVNEMPDVKEEIVEESDDEEPEVTEPEPGEFELVVDNLDDLRDLIKRFADPEPIIEKKGKKEKVIQPPPRKRCEKELHDHLAYLLSELEPWEQKLLQANKKAKVRMRKEHESYVEEPEPKEDVWSSEEEVESSEDDSEDGSSDDNATMKNEDERPKRPRRRPMTEVEKEAFSAELPDELGISSRGRIRKRRIIPNNIEDQGLRKRKKEPDHSPSPTPNILQKNKSSTITTTVTSPMSQPQYKAVLNQLQMPAALSAAKGSPGGFQLLSINNQMVLVSTGPQKDKNGNPVPTTQPTVLAHISGTSQPVALPLNVVTALQAQAKLQQQQQQHQQATPSTPGQLALKNLIANRTAVGSVASGSQVTNKTTKDSSVSVAPSQVTSVTATAASTTVVTPSQQSSVKTIDPKLLPQLLLQKGKGAGAAAVAVTTGSTVSVPVNVAASVGKDASIRPQFYHYNNIAKLPQNVVQQLTKANTQQIIKAKPPPTPTATVTTAVMSNNLPASQSQIGGATALTNLIQAGLMPQAPKVTSLVTSPQAPSSLPQPLNAQISPATSNDKQQEDVATTALNTISSTTVSASSNTTIPVTHVVTVTVSPGGVITNSPVKSSQSKQISPELLSKLQAQGVPSGIQPNIAAMIQANPSLFKSLNSPPKQKYASNVTVKSLLEKRALQNLRQKSDAPEPVSKEPEMMKQLITPSAQPENVSSKSKVTESSQASITKLSPITPKPMVTKLSPAPVPVAVRLQSPNATSNGSNAPAGQIIQGGAIRKIQLTPQKPQQAQVRGQIVQQQQPGVSQVQTVTVNPNTNILTIQQNLTPQQLQILQQQLASKLGVQNVPQNIQVVQQVAGQTSVSQQSGNVAAGVSQLQGTQTQTIKQIRVPSGTVTIQPKGLVPASPTAPVRCIAPKQQTTGRLSESTIDNALKTVMTGVQTSLPTAQIKVSSPFATSTRNVTIITSAMKSPIPAVPSIEAMATSAAKTQAVNTYKGSVVSATVPSVTTAASGTAVSTVINTTGANAIRIIPDANGTLRANTNAAVNQLTVQQTQQQMSVPAAALLQGLGAQKNVVVKMKPQNMQGLVVTQGAIQPQVTNTQTVSLAVNQPKSQLHPQVMQNVLLDQSKAAAGSLQIVQVTNSAVTVSAASAVPAMSSNIVTPVSKSPAGGVSTQLQNLASKIPISPKIRISSHPCTKPQTIQQLIESKAKAASTANKVIPTVISKPNVGNKPTVVMPGTTPGAPVRVVQHPPVVASAAVAATCSPATSSSPDAILSPNSGTTLTTVMANIGGKMVQLRVAVPPGQNISQILQSPQLQQQLQQLQQQAIQSGGIANKTATITSSTATVQQPQAAPQLSPKQQTVPTVVPNVGNNYAVKSGSKTIRALTSKNLTQQSSAVEQISAAKPTVHTKIPAAPPQILNAKNAAPRTVQPGNVGPAKSSQQLVANAVASENTANKVTPQNPAAVTSVQQILGATANLAQGKIVLVNVGGQIMAAQNVGGKTILMPQSVNVVNQNAAGTSQGIVAQPVANVQQTVLTASQAVGTPNLQTAQQIPVSAKIMSPNDGAAQNGQVNIGYNSTSKPAVGDNTVCLPDANLPTSSPSVPPSPTIQAGSLVMIGSGLTPVPTAQSNSSALVLSGPIETSSAGQSLPSPTFRHNMPQQLQLARQTVAIAAGPLSSTVAAGGGLEQLALAAAQVQEAMQHQQNSNVVQKPLNTVNPGSNANQANNTHMTNQHAALPNGNTLP